MSTSARQQRIVDEIAGLLLHDIYLERWPKEHVCDATRNLMPVLLGHAMAQVEKILDYDDKGIVSHMTWPAPSLGTYELGMVIDLIEESAGNADSDEFHRVMSILEAFKKTMHDAVEIERRRPHGRGNDDDSEEEGEEAAPKETRSRSGK